MTTQEMTVARALGLTLNGKFNEKVSASEWLRQHIAKLEADARRYRWLREYDIDSYLANGKLEHLDQAIDRAMGEEKVVKLEDELDHCERNIKFC